MKRRDFLRFLLATPIALQLDVEKLLWVPGEKTIFLPPPPPRPTLLSLSEIVDLELQRIRPGIVQLFNSDNALFTMLKSGKLVSYETGPMRVPWQMKVSKGIKDVDD